MEPTTQTTHTATPPSDEWSLGELYSKAYVIARKNPVLWWFSLAIGAGSYSYQGGNGGGSSSDSESFQKLFDPKGQEQAAKVLGDSINPLTDLFTQVLQAIPWYFYLILGLEVLAFIVLGLLIQIIYKAWTQAGQLNGIETSIKGEKPTMHEMSEKAFPLIMSFIWLDIVPGILFGLFAVFSLGLLGILFVIVPESMKIIAGILFGLGILAICIGALYLMMILIWAPRKIVSDHVSARVAFMLGMKIAKKKFWKTLLFGIVNMIVGLFVFGIAIGIPLLIFVMLSGIAALLWQSVMGLSIRIIVVLVLLIVAWIILLTLAMGMFDSFKAAFWSLAYHQIKGKYEH